MSDATAMGSQAERRRSLLGAVSMRGEKPEDELQRALGRAHLIVGERGRGMETEDLLLARAVVRLSSHLTELAERERGRAGRDVETTRVVAENLDLVSRLSAAQESIRLMMSKYAKVESEQEEAIELMLAMLASPKHRVSDHPEWISALKSLSGSE